MSSYLSLVFLGTCASSTFFVHVASVQVATPELGDASASAIDSSSAIQAGATPSRSLRVSGQEQLRPEAQALQPDETGQTHEDHRFQPGLMLLDFVKRKTKPGRHQGSRKLRFQKGPSSFMQSWKQSFKKTSLDYLVAPMEKVEGEMQKQETSQLDRAKESAGQPGQVPVLGQGVVQVVQQGAQQPALQQVLHVVHHNMRDGPPAATQSEVQQPLSTYVDTHLQRNSSEAGSTGNSSAEEQPVVTSQIVVAQPIHAQVITQQEDGQQTVQQAVIQPLPQTVLTAPQSSEQASQTDPQASQAVQVQIPENSGTQPTVVVVQGTQLQGPPAQQVISQTVLQPQQVPQVATQQPGTQPQQVVEQHANQSRHGHRRQQQSADSSAAQAEQVPVVVQTMPDQALGGNTSSIIVVAAPPAADQSSSVPVAPPATTETIPSVGPWWWVWEFLTGLTYTGFVKILCVLGNVVVQGSPYWECRVWEVKRDTGNADSAPYVAVAYNGWQWCFYGVLAWLITGRSGFLILLHSNILGAVMGVYYVHAFYKYCKDSEAVSAMWRYLSAIAALCLLQVAAMGMLDSRTALLLIGLISAFCGFIGAVSLVVTVPEVIRLKDSSSIPGKIVAANLFSGVSWAMCGFMLQDPLITLPSVAVILCCVICMILKAQFPDPADDWIYDALRQIGFRSMSSMEVPKKEVSVFGIRVGLRRNISGTGEAEVCDLVAESPEKPSEIPANIMEDTPSGHTSPAATPVPSVREVRTPPPTGGLNLHEDDEALSPVLIVGARSPVPIWSSTGGT